MLNRNKYEETYDGMLNEINIKILLAIKKELVKIIEKALKDGVPPTELRQMITKIL